jgi:hypothetical protein
MRETSKNRPPLGARWGDIKKDFTPEQRLLIGDICLAFNELEGNVDTLFYLVTGLHESLALEVNTRINGIEGKVEIISAGLKLIDLEPNDLTQIRVALGEGTGFKGLKKHRDAVIHARIVNAILGVGYKIDRRASFTRVLVTVDALEALYSHIEACNEELKDAWFLLHNLKVRDQVAIFADDLRKALFAEATTEYLARFRSHRFQTQSLPPLPQLPSEEEMQAAHDAWIQAQLQALKGEASTEPQD